MKMSLLNLETNFSSADMTSYQALKVQLLRNAGIGAIS
jgi:hypothetical protein